MFKINSSIPGNHLLINHCKLICVEHVNICFLFICVTKCEMYSICEGIKLHYLPLLCDNIKIIPPCNITKDTVTCLVRKDFLKFFVKQLYVLESELAFLLCGIKHDKSMTQCIWDKDAQIPIPAIGIGSKIAGLEIRGKRLFRLSIGYQVLKLRKRIAAQGLTMVKIQKKSQSTWQLLRSQ